MATKFKLDVRVVYTVQCPKCEGEGPWTFSRDEAEQCAREACWGQGRDGLVCPTCLEDQVDAALREFEKGENEKEISDDNRLS